MKLVLYVHDLRREVGHSRALIEKINHLPNNLQKKITEIEAVCYHSSHPNELFPAYLTKLTKCPGNWLWPSLFKIIFFHFFSAIHYFKSKKENTKFISIGIASLFCDIVDVQFIHRDWSEFYFKAQKKNWLAIIYKKILFFYLNTMEGWAYRRPGRTFLALSHFIQQNLIKHFSPQLKIKQVQLCYSGVNLSEFSTDYQDRQKMFQILCNKYPQIVSINPNQPIGLFVGAFERKGLNRVIQWLQHNPQNQLIIVGQGEYGSKFSWPKDLKIVHVLHTSIIQLFYALSDYFIFPTEYEPFGLVIIEAASMGLDVYVPNENVGASEIIKNIPWAHFIDIKQDILPITPIIVPSEEKQKRNSHFKKNIHLFGWPESAKKLGNILEKTD